VCTFALVDPLSPLWLALAFGVVLVVIKLLARPHTVVRIEGGRASVVRGRPPSGLMGELLDLAAHAPGAAGRIELLGGGHRLTLRTPGLDEGMAQRVRNVVFLYRDRIR
jgi:hypothetical protein